MMNNKSSVISYKIESLISTANTRQEISCLLAGGVSRASVQSE